MHFTAIFKISLLIQTPLINNKLSPMFQKTKNISFYKA